ncbi:MAG TPA: hypothetical protein VFJ85_19670 [Acidimicrobiales bacterium]|nr:hypothetical protein [Acidimicrobiales bacterium]
MRGRARRVAVLAGLALLGSSVVASGAGAAAGPVEDAQAAARRIPFTARIEISWVDRDSFHTAELTVRSVGGNVRLQAAGLQVGDDESFVLPDGELLVPALERKYDVSQSSGPTVAGRETELYSLRTAGVVREELAVDRSSGLVLQRQVFGAKGTPVRTVTVLQLDTAPMAEPAPAARHQVSVPRTISVSSVPAAYRGPAVLPGGYSRVAAYRHGQLVHLLYSDGLHGMSLFSQPGHLASASLPQGGEAVQVGVVVGVHYTWPGGDVVAWQSGPLVHTLVGDGTVTDLLAAAGAVPTAGGTSLLGRLRQTSRMVAELVSGGR